MREGFLKAVCALIGHRTAPVTFNRRLCLRCDTTIYTGSAGREIARRGAAREKDVDRRTGRVKSSTT